MKEERQGHRGTGNPIVGTVDFTEAPCPIRRTQVPVLPTPDQTFRPDQPKNFAAAEKFRSHTTSFHKGQY
jgi:hypothetical protein